MSQTVGDMDEMPSPVLDDRALDALLSGGRSAPAGFDWLVHFVEELGEASRTPAPVVRPALATLLTQGFSVEESPLPAAVVTSTPPSRKRRGLAVRAVVGLTLATASATAAGAAGVLPDAAQHAVATVVAAATPFTFPDTADDPPPVNSRSGFGTMLSNDATGASDGVPGVDGRAVSDAARTKQGGDVPGVPGSGVGANSGSTGLDRANETPAAGHAPTSVPVPTTGPPASPGSQASNGLSTAATTPAAGHLPTTVPPAGGAGPAPGSIGLDKANNTPAAGRAPASTPGRP